MSDEPVTEVYAVEVDTPYGSVLVQTVHGKAFYEHKSAAEYVLGQETKTRTGRLVVFKREPKP